MSIELPQSSNPNAPSNGRTLIFANQSGNLATKDASGQVREYSPTPIESENMVYGVRWNTTTGDPDCEPGILVNGSFVGMDYQNMPVHEQMGRGLLTGDGQWTKLSPYNSAQLEDGSTATIDGTAGQVMVRSPYRFYQNIQTIGDYVYMLLSEQPFTFNGVSAWVPPVYMDDGYFFVGAFHGVALSDSTSSNVGSCVKDTSGYTSNSYPDPFTNITIGASRSQCSNTGAVFCQYSNGMHDLLYFLAVTKFKTFDVQAQIEGHTERSSFDYAQATKAGATLALGDFSGSIWDDDAGMYIANSFQGVENFFGNTWKLVDGIAFDTDNNYRVYVAHDPTVWSTAEADILANYIDTGHAPGWDDNDDYIKSVVGSGKHIPLFPDVVGGGADSSTYITDYLGSGPLGSGWRFSDVGGHSGDARPAGPGARAVGRWSSYSGSYCGPRLAAYISLAST